MTRGRVPVGDEQVVEAVLALADATAVLQDADLTSLSDVGLTVYLQALESLSRHRSVCERAGLAEVTRRGVASAQGYASEATYLRDVLNVSVSEANRRVREVAWLAPRSTLTGDLPARYPTLAAASNEGAVSGEHVAVIATFLDGLPDAVSPEERVDAEAELTLEARTAIPAAVARSAIVLGQRLDPAGTLAKEREQRANATVTLSKALHGMIRISGLLDPDSGAILRTALDGLSKPAPGPDGERDPRDAGKRRADALVQIARWSLGASGMPAHGGRKPQLVLTMTVDDFRDGTGLATTQWGDLVTAETLARHACDAEIALAKLDRGGAVLNLGRTARLISPDQRRALNLRDRGCVFPGCDRPPAWCQGHHILDWIKGGRTDLDNLCLLCTRHHTKIHREGWQIVMLRGRPHCVPPKSIDPEQKPRLNTAHAPPLLVAA